MIVPSVPDWAWLGRQRLEDVARVGTQSSEPATWVKKAYAWVYGRLDAKQRKSLPSPIVTPRGPLQGMVPIVGACFDGTGCLGFVSVQYKPAASPPPTEDTERAAHDAATAVAEIFRRLDHGLGQPYVELMLRDAGGESVGLSSLIAAMINLLSVTPRDDFAATGCFNAVNGLQPVEGDTLPIKIETAKAWGYRRLLVVEGQPGISPSCGVEIVEIPCNLTYALLAILREVTTSPSGLALARVLAVFDQVAVRADPRDQELDRTLQVTQDFVNPATPELARHVAHDIRSRALLHAGRTEEANEEKRNADQLRPKPLEFPSGWLGDYLKWHQVAHHAVLALDQGRWDDGQPEHQLVDRTLERLLGAISDQQAGREELLAALFLSNTRARRLDFLGRWRRDSELLCRAWDDVTRFRSYWLALFEYCRQIGLNDSDLHRQHNYCIEVLASYWHLKGRLPEPWREIGHTFWPATSAVEVEQLGPFDLANLLRWKAIFGQEVGVDFVDRVLKTAQKMFERAQGGYPTFLAFETVLRYRMGDDEQQRMAADALARSCLFSSVSPASILVLLALRASRLLETIGYHQLKPTRPTQGTSLAVRAEELLHDPETLVDRCPY